VAQSKNPIGISTITNIIAHAGIAQTMTVLAAMNIQQLGTQYVSGVENPKFEKQKANS
jgi:hypothetical protein